MRLKPFAAALALIAAPAAATLAPGAKAPDFSTRGAVAGKVVPVRLADALKRGPVVLYFFPAAFTGGCNAEAHAFSEAVPAFQKAGATVIGMSTDDVGTLQRFSTEKCAGRFTVASAGPAVVKGYDVAFPKQIPGPDGRLRLITSRTSYVIAPDGRVAFVHSDMNPAEHVSLTLAAVRRLSLPSS